MTTAKNEVFIGLQHETCNLMGDSIFGGGTKICLGGGSLVREGEFPCGGISKFSASVGGLPPPKPIR